MATRVSLGAVRALKKVSEPVRERETFKYDPSLFGNIRINDTGRPFPPSEIFTANDIVLTALAQLGTYQTGAGHSIVSLFDTDYQYYVAEATPSLPLRPGISSEDCPDEIWFCGTAIPRNHGACEYTLLGAGTGKPDENGQCPQLPVTVVDDLAADPLYKNKPYCQAGGPLRFYASVPIRTQRGINIGVYCILNPKPIEGWGEHHEDRLRDISKSIMQHLETKRSKLCSDRNERMNRGLGSFIGGNAKIRSYGHVEGRGTTVNSINRGDASFTKHIVPDQPDQGSPKLTEAAIDDDASGELPMEGNGLLPTVGEEAVIDMVADTQPPALHGNGKHSHTHTVKQETNDNRKDHNSPSAVLSRAANIIREAIDVDGCVFFDATIASYRPGSKSKIDSEMDGTSAQSSTTSSDDEEKRASTAEKRTSGHLLAISTSQSSCGDCSSPENTNEAIPESFVMKLLHRYPHGKIFVFDVDGELQSPDSSEEESTILTPPVEASFVIEAAVDGLSPPIPSKPGRRNSTRVQQNEGSVLAKAFPGVRSVAFVPVWDPKKERWFAGGFIYTLDPTRIFTIQGELSFIRAFGVLAAAEILRVETVKADKAKSDALGSLSHELRSPLHGVLLGAELLNDTDLCVFQRNVTHMIETCCRTLLDTIDHLLDYSKVNSFPTNKKRDPAGLSQETSSRSKVAFSGVKNLYSTIRLDALVEEVMESVTAGFNFQFISAQELSAKRPSTTSYSDFRAYRRIDSMQAVEQLGPLLNRIGDQLELDSAGLSIFLSVDPECSWVFHVHVGAIRRIVMNLFGNALKYTQRGSVTVSISQESSPRFTRRRQRLVKLTVKDTGKGIGEEFLRHKLFRPFIQEDELSSGTGLGLSLVKQVVTQLKGRISFESQVGVGTTATITLPLELPADVPDAPPIVSITDFDEEFEEHIHDLRGLRLKIVGFDKQDGVNGNCNSSSIIRGICQGWLRMEVIDDVDDDSITPDLVLWSDAALPTSLEDAVTRAKCANVVACPNVLVAYNRFASFDSTDGAGIFEFVAQPMAPRKLARALLLAYKRWTGHVQPPSPALSPLTVRQPVGPDGQPCSFIVPCTSPMSETLPHSMDSSIESTPSAETSGRVSPPNYSLTMPVRSPSVERTPRTAPAQMLLVDDNHINLKILSTYMKKIGQDYQTAVNGQEAVDAYRKDPAGFVCILMDISMPIMDGFEATRAIRAHELQRKLSPVPIFALTGLASEKAQQEAFGSGVDLFLAKPVKLKALGSLLASRGIAVA